MARNISAIGLRRQVFFWLVALAIFVAFLADHAVTTLGLLP